jgi:predicted acylesterase/phospholipase RssA
MNDLREARIGLALSGGGFRATLFHLGVIRFLLTSGGLKQVTQISAVSGGSILAAHLVLNWEKYIGTSSFQHAAKEIIDFVQTDIRGLVIRRWLLACCLVLPQLFRTKKWNLGNLLQAQYEKLFASARIRQLRGTGRPKVAFNCASLSVGTPCYFNESGFGWHADEMDRVLAAPEMPVAFAVAASSAFPPLFPPLRITNETLVCAVNQFPQSHYLTDGGVYDNLGIELLFRGKEGGREFDLIVVSDAEGNFDSDFDARYAFPVSRNVRASDLLMSRISALQIGALRETTSVVRIGIKGEIEDVDDPSLLSPEAQRSLVNVRTDLDEFSPTEVTALIAHGYSKARSELIKHECVPESEPKFSWDPLGNWTYVQSPQGTQELRRARIRRLRIWSCRDWSSWVTIAILIVLVAAPLTALFLTLDMIKGIARGQF